VLLAPEFDPSLAASGGSGIASGKSGVAPKNRVWNFFGSPGEKRRVEPVQAIETAPCCASCTYENASGRSHWKVYGPDLNGHYGSLQGTGGLEATILDFGGTTQGVINDQFGNGVASVTGSTATWFSTRVGAYGPLPGTQAATLTDITQLAASTAWRGRRIDPTGFYDLGARYYEPTSGRFLSADPFGQAASPSLYDFAGGDPVNSFDPTGRCPDKNSNQGNTSGQQLADQIANFQFVDPVNGGQNPADPQVAQQNVYITDSGSTVPLTPGSLTWDQIQNLQMDSLDAATILRLLGLDYQKFGLENIQINAARLALYANQGQSQLAQVRAIGFMAYAVNLLVSVFQPRAETPIETGAWSAGFAQDAAGVTVIGSMRDVAPYLTKSEFNTLLIPNFQYLDPAVVDSINANFMRVAIQRGDDFWLVTDPVAHTINSQQFNFESRYLNIEIPMLNTGRGVVIPTAPTR